VHESLCGRLESRRSLLFRCQSISSSFAVRVSLDALCPLSLRVRVRVLVLSPISRHPCEGRGPVACSVRDRLHSRDLLFRVQIAVIPPTSRRALAPAFAGVTSSKHSREHPNPHPSPLPKGEGAERVERNSHCDGGRNVFKSKTAEATATATATTTTTTTAEHRDRSHSRNRLRAKSLLRTRSGGAPTERSAICWPFAAARHQEWCHSRFPPPIATPTHAIPR